MMNVRQTALELADKCDHNYQTYTAFVEKGLSTLESHLAKRTSLASNNALILYLKEQFPNPLKMNEESYDSLVEEVRRLLSGGPTDNLSDCAFVYHVMRMILKDKKVVTFIMSDEWKSFAEIYTGVVMGKAYPPT